MTTSPLDCGGAEPPLRRRTDPASSPEARAAGRPGAARNTPGAAAPPVCGTRGSQSSSPQAFPGTGGEDPDGATLEALPRSRPLPGGATPRSPGRSPARPRGAPAGDRPATDPSGDAATQYAASSDGATWTIELPAGLALLSMNGREHWAARNRTYQSLKKAAWAMTLNARVPKLERVEVQGVYDPPDRRRRDGENYQPSVKAAIDGIVSAGCLPDDNSRYVLRSWCEIGDVYPRGRLRLIIREVAP